MDAYQQVANKLQELGITFDVVEHPPAFTTEQADSYIEGMEGVRTKSMFLTNKKKTQYYLLIMDDKKSLDMDVWHCCPFAFPVRLTLLWRCCKMCIRDRMYNKAFGSDDNFYRLEIDYRQYKTLGRRRDLA